MRVNRYMRAFLYLLCLLFCFLIILKPTRHGTSGDIYSILHELYVNLLYLRGNGCDVRIYGDGGRALRKENLIGVLSIHRKYDEDICAFHITDSGYWFGYNMAPYCKYVVWAIDFGRFYGVDKLKISTRERLERVALERGAGASGYSLYGSSNIKDPPLSADASYIYKASDNAVWMHLPFEQGEMSDPNKHGSYYLNSQKSNFLSDKMSEIKSLMLKTEGAVR
jgi:hypothetical protein